MSDTRIWHGEGRAGRHSDCGTESQEEMGLRGAAERRGAQGPCRVICSTRALWNHPSRT